MMPNVKKYIREAKKLPNTITCNNVKKLCDDKLAVAEISFFASVSAMCEPFLKAFQTPSPLAPLHSLMTFVRCNSLSYVIRQQKLGAISFKITHDQRTDWINSTITYLDRILILLTFSQSYVQF